MPIASDLEVNNTCAIWSCLDKIRDGPFVSSGTAENIRQPRLCTAVESGSVGIYLWKTPHRRQLRRYRGLPMHGLTHCVIRSRDPSMLDEIKAELPSFYANQQ